jgi:hypothetical protein
MQHCWQVVHLVQVSALLLLCAVSFDRSTYSKQPIKQAWVLARVCGEPVSAAPLEAINPEHPPEAIVAAQLQAFRYFTYQPLQILP